MKSISDTIHPTGEEALTFEVSDEALEAAAGTMKVQAGAFTMAFCSGVNSCPAIHVEFRRDRR